MKAGALTHSSVILRCEPSGAPAPLGEPRRMNRPQTGRASFEARKSAHLRMTVPLIQLDDDVAI
ncbi:hypothetical protein XH93_30615 [Bradyrhizobium sp. CCBAU 51753]|nr:hypothetical protein XH93_30615 [Bradyrhizobium sp. CCBAU 51753]